MSIRRSLADLAETSVAVEAFRFGAHQRVEAMDGCTDDGMPCFAAGLFPTVRPIGRPVPNVRKRETLAFVQHVVSVKLQFRLSKG